MTLTQKLKSVAWILLFIFFGLLWYELFYAKHRDVPSPLIGEEVPPFQLPDLYQTQKIFSQKELTGKVILLNVWATWCYACTLEHAMLMKINQEYHVPIYGIDYKDNRDVAINWLAQNGNPYVMTGLDYHGDVAIDLGVYGTPETFVISPYGKIIYRHVGAIDENTWTNVLYPMILKYAN